MLSPPAELPFSGSEVGLRICISNKVMVWVPNFENPDLGCIGHLQALTVIMLCGPPTLCTFCVQSLAFALPALSTFQKAMLAVQDGSGLGKTASTNP